MESHCLNGYATTFVVHPNVFQKYHKNRGIFHIFKCSPINHRFRGNATSDPPPIETQKMRICFEIRSGPEPENFRSGLRSGYDESLLKIPVRTPDPDPVPDPEACPP